MRDTLLAWLPADLRGRRMLDAGCGTGALAVEAARRGARVVAIDLSPTLVGLARERSAARLGAGSVEFRVGDMLDPALGRFDHVVAMDSLIHYRAGDVVAAIAGLAAAHRALGAVHLRAAHAGAGRDACGRPAVPARRPRAGDRAGRPRRRSGAASPRSRVSARGALARTERIASGFYIVAGAGADRAHDAAQRQPGTRLDAGSAPRFLPFADAATAELPLGRLLRLSLFQVSVGIAVVLLNGTLNRVMIVELGVPTWLVA